MVIRSHHRGYLLQQIPLVAIFLVGCPPTDPDGDLPSCEELACQGGAICLDGACRPRDCTDLNCPSGTVCQGGPLCVREDLLVDPVCWVIGCIEGYQCQPGPLCRDPREDQDGDGVRSQLDCDDGDAARWPGNTEVCNGIDNDCNGEADNEAPCLDDRRCCGSAGCVNPNSHREHCGACGRRCQIYEECDTGVCVGAPPPLVTGISPDPLPTGVWFGRDDELAFTIAGEHLLGFATVYLESAAGSSAADPFEMVTSSGGRAYALDQPMLIDGAQLPGGAATLRLVRNDGAESNVFALTVQGAQRPVVTRVSPDPLPLADEVTFSVYGTGFWGAPQIFIAPDSPEPDWVELPVQWVTETWVRTGIVELDPTEHRAGPWLSMVRNQDEAESDPFAFEVTPAPPPELTGLAPTEVPLGALQALEIFGYDMFGRPTVLLAPAGSPEEPFPPLELDLTDPRRLVTMPVDFNPEIFAPGPYSLWIINPDETPSNVLRINVIP